MAATLFLMSQGALSYTMAGREIPEEFRHNVPQLYAKYLTYVDSSFQWTVPSDPGGDATLFPFAFDAEFETAIVAVKTERGDLWRPAAPVAAVGLGADLWEACQNAKVVLYHLMGSYFWHVTPKLAQPAPVTDPSAGRPRPVLADGQDTQLNHPDIQP